MGCLLSPHCWTRDGEAEEQGLYLFLRELQKKDVKNTLLGDLDSEDY